MDESCAYQSVSASCTEWEGCSSYPLLVRQGGAAQDGARKRQLTSAYTDIVNV